MHVVINLGPAGVLASRHLVISRVHYSGDAGETVVIDELLAGNVETVTCELPSNRLYVARLTDTDSVGRSSVVDSIHFHTGELLFPGPRSGDRLRILQMEEDSSSSSSGSSSPSSVSSSSFSSESSQSSPSSQSTSSESSTSSLSTSSSSSSSSSQSSSSFSSRSSNSSSSVSTSSNSSSSSSPSSQSPSSNSSSS